MPQEPNSDIRDQIREESKTTQKVELLISNQEAESDQEVSINFMNVFGNMKKKRNLYVRVMTVFLIIGILAPLVMHQMNKSETDAVAIISYTDVGEGEEVPYDVSMVKSGYVISKAIDKVFLSEKLPSSFVEGNITIDRLISSETRQNYDRISSIAKDATANEASQLWEGFEIKYSNQYVITLKNGFSSGEPGARPVYIRDSELSALLEAIVDSYSDYLYETYGDYRLPDNILESVNFDKTEYSVVIDYISEQLDGLSEYCRSKSKKYPAFVSNSDGHSFADLDAYIGLIKDIDLDWCSSYLWNNSIARDQQTLLNDYTYSLRSCNLQLAEIKENLDAVDSTIKSYERDKIVVAAPEATGGNEASVTTDYFNRLIIERLELAFEYNKTEEKIIDLTDRISKIGGRASDSAKIKVLEDKTRELFDNTKEMYNVVCSHADELFSTGAVQNGFIDAAYTTVSNESSSDSVTTIDGSEIREESLVKNVAVGAAIGIVLAVVIWACDALITELKAGNGRKKEEEL